MIAQEVAPIACFVRWARAHARHGHSVATKTLPEAIGLRFRILLSSQGGGGCPGRFRARPAAMSGARVDILFPMQHEMYYPT